MQRSLIHLGRILAISICTLDLTSASYAQGACEADKVTASDGGPFESFGWAVAASSNTVLVGARNDFGDTGAAFAFTFDGANWRQEQKLLASDGEFNDFFGGAVELNAERAMIAASGDDDVALNTGAVYFFQLDGTTWVEHQKLVPSDGADNHGFGRFVSICGDVAIIGANGDSSAYVFRFNPETSLWFEEQKLVASDGAGGQFGRSVSVSGDVAVVGAGQSDGECDGAPASDSGAAYVFRFDPTGAAGSQWAQEQKLVASDCAAQDAFGHSVSVNRGVILVGALGDDFSSGSAYVFCYDARSSRWIEEQKLVVADGQANDQFGRSVAFDGDTALVGAFLNDDAGTNHGAAYVYRFEDSAWVEKSKVLPDPGPWTAFFGFSVDVFGDTAVAGAYGEDAQSGAAYVFVGLPDVCECPWDCGGDNDGDVGITDFLALLAQWGSPGSCDFDGGDVGINDFLLLLANWGPCS